MTTNLLNFIILKKHIFLLIFMLSQVNSEEDHVDIEQYTKDNFLTEIERQSHFVIFYAQSCDQCQKLEPTWEQLTKLSNQRNNNVKIVKVDCTVDSSLCADHDITDYPTVKVFKAGQSKGTKFYVKKLSSLMFCLDLLDTIFEDKDIVPLPPKAVNGLLELTEDTFDKHISTGYHFIKFYVPWCGHCQKLAPTWDELANSLRNNNYISISKIDCTQHRNVCEQFNIKAYPALLWIEDGKKVDKYAGLRTHEELKTYISKMLEKGNDEANIKTDNSESISYAVVSLTGESFKHGIENGVSFVKFFAPWCGHCKRLAPIWKDLGKKFLTNKDVNIIKVDCTLNVSKRLCIDQEVDGFPSLYLYRDGLKISEYNGARNLDDLYEYVMNYVQPHDEL